MSKDLEEIKNLLQLHPTRPGYKCVFAYVDGEVRLLGHSTSKEDAGSLADFFRIPFKDVSVGTVQPHNFFMVL